MKRILVGLDGSPRAPGVLSAAVVLARADAGRIALMRAVGLPADVPQDFWKSTEEPLLDVLSRRAQEYLRECAAQVPSELLADRPIEVVVGTPWEAVCNAARTAGMDVIVIGSHGYGALDRLLGTTAAKIVNHAPCSVLVVRESNSREGPR
jgi:nucleotide-binding universal stress UspA family protein